MFFRFLQLLTATALASFVPLIGAQVILTHNGANDPANEGWTLSTPVGGTVGAIANDLGAGIAAWNIADTSTSNGFLYYNVPTAGQIAQGFSQGWTMTATLRLTGAAPSNGFMGFGYQDGTNAWNFYPQQNAGNDFVIAVYGASSFTLSGGGSDYHTVTWLYHPGTSTADLFVDGVARITNFAGSPNLDAELFFGGGGSTSTGSANYSFVQFAVIPEPAAGSILLAGIVVAAAARRRFR